ncbi:acyl-CoA dehydrogenase family protein [Aestuariicoccus sp. MJ-SS9]|uniref:acyl-CoA dehydrogenase family protein n=1 Tax=Aestuariicoccus sp. MJ-SS9 TaxID=3079855 RepID=UPI0029080BD4|nr:acyl-CoA dehydrogenase family protein [Aestuariicoccus sp. MJ-SS9]MDU8912301.1 acyl-CoA dehydrogenase family protein [Aestuariicoccus sp. MJ-SS9]
MTDADDFLDRVDAFARGPVARAAPGWSMGQTPDPGLIRDAAAIGLTGITTPTAFGGKGQGFATLAEACETLAAVEFGFAMSLVNTQNVGLRLCLSASDAVRDMYLPRLLSGEISACTALTEPGVGTDFAAVTTRATEADGTWRIRGEKTWIINGRHAGLAMVFAQCGADRDATGIGGFLVDLNQPGVRRYPIDSGFAQTSMGTGGFVLEDAVAAGLLLPPGGAFKSILTEINAARCYVAAMCNGLLGEAIAQAAAYGAQRESFGKPLDQHAAWRQPLGAAATDLAASRALTGRAVSQIATGQDAQLSAAKAKIAATETAQRHIPQMLHAMGAAGLRPEYCFTRHLAAAHIAGFTDGATGILRDRVARLTGTDVSPSRR